MPYEMQIDPTGIYLDLNYHGVVPVAERMRAADEALQILAGSGVRRILIDLSLATAAPEDTLQDFSAFGARITREPLFLQSRTAFVAPRVHYVNYTIERFADARHYPFSRFTDRAEALEWLLGDAPPLGRED